MAAAAFAALMAADEAASAVAEAAPATAEAAVSAAEAAVFAAAAAEEAASAAGAVVSAGLLQAARATAATRVANRSDLFMNFLEEFGSTNLPVVLNTCPRKQALLAKDSRASSSIFCA
jgi:hypothetical protein